MSDNLLQELHPLFHPKNIAVVGASPKIDPMMMSQGNNYIKGSIEQNFSGKIFPVHPKAKAILGFPAYPRVKDIPEPVDLVIFTVPAEASLEVMKDCVEKKVKFVHLYTAGFGESGRDDFLEMEKKLIDLARKNGIRIVGPNCMGLYCPEGGLAFQPMFPNVPGPVGFFSQSGQMAGMFVMNAAAQGLRFSKVTSFGNARDLKAHDFLNYLAQDEKTKIIGSYLEGLNDGRAFLEAARKVSSQKPLVIFKGGMTEGGSRAAMSHTAAIAGSSRIWRAVCRQTGIISVTSLEELVFTLSALQRMPLPRGKNVAILGGAGGGSVTMTDQAEAEGLKVPQLSDDTIRELETIVPPQGTSVKNPLDVGRRFFAGDNFNRVMELLRDDDRIDALIFMQPIAMFNRFGGRTGISMLLKQTLAGQNILKKPMILVVEKNDGFGGDRVVKEAIERYHAANLATFPDFRLAVKITGYLADYQAYLDRQ
ncbi:MAG: CoA-binding protein [Deltaproteobacteria bacterium]|nr:CoA-binding protein [Deltaproteobacteria bacterium]